MTAFLCAISITGVQSASSERYSMTKEQAFCLYLNFDHLLDQNITDETFSPKKCTYLQLLAAQAIIAGACYAPFKVGAPIVGCATALYISENTNFSIKAALSNINPYFAYKYYAELDVLKIIKETRTQLKTTIGGIQSDNYSDEGKKLTLNQINAFIDSLQKLSGYKAPSFIKNAFTNLAIAGACYYAASKGLFANPTFNKHALFAAGAWYLINEKTAALKVAEQHITMLTSLKK